jgi:hypothetical protein
MFCADRLKITLPSAYTTARLAWSCMFYESLYSQTLYQGFSMYQWCVREVKWSVQYLLKCHIQQNGKDALVVQVCCQQ